MTKLSVNINKIATLRNARGGNNPDVIKVAVDCQSYGANGITVHPRPDERHIRWSDVIELRKVVTTEFNIEGNPTPHFLERVLKVKPDQVTLVPDEPDAITSHAGWDTRKHLEFLIPIIKELQANGIRTSIFLDPLPEMVLGAKQTGTDRVELYTEAYSTKYPQDKEKAIAPYRDAAKIAVEYGMEVNAGHDLNLDNLYYFNQNIIGLKEVSIGHALICDSLYFGLHNTIQMYLNTLI